MGRSPFNKDKKPINLFDFIPVKDTKVIFRKYEIKPKQQTPDIRP